MTIATDPRLLLGLEQARHEAATRGHDRVARMHLALGLLGSRDGLATSILRGLGAEPDHLRRRIEPALPPSGPPTDPTALGYSANAARVLQSAVRLSSEGGHPAIRVEHLLLALAGLEGGAVAELLESAGATDATIRTQLQTFEGHAATLPLLSVEADSATPVYQQIISRIREAVAEGRLRPDERLPPVRQLAGHLHIAPGTVARAYQELEQLGIVSTDGSRGTHIAPPRAVEVPRLERTATLLGLLRPVAVAAAYLGASADEVRSALEHALAGILQRGETGL